MKPWRVAVAGLLLAFVAAAGAQSYPSRTIKLVVPYAPGGAGDVIARIVSDRLGKELGTTVVVATHDIHLISRIENAQMMRLEKGRLADPTGALRYPPANRV